jgi:putative PIN family toxin of toxin-antitoxin system
VRAVLDANILVSALLSPRGAPGRILSLWIDGEYELVASLHLLSELDRTLHSPKFRGRLDSEESAAFVALIEERATIAVDPDVAPTRSADPADDYLLALAESERAVLVSGDQHLLDLADAFPIFTARQFLRTLETDG